ncbi:serine/threonine-protein kinase [Nocardiopsis dassonvillei]|uniref:serine/threonine-protein kinase n=1 Tax=Nocardiopsis dassonvillei TaxID=2014 RepID=UPI00367310EF
MLAPLLPNDPTQVGPYTLHARLGGGGMGQVFLGRSPGGRTVAVKVVRPELADDAEFRHRFAAEVVAARKVGGFYTAQVVDADTEANPLWLATAYIPGPTLYRAVADHGPLPAETVAALGAGLAEGLTAVHAQGVVHRDLKPGNILLADDGPRIIDFGIAHALEATSHTHSSTVVGTAAFMSPEQAKAQKVGPASDVFSLGCVLVFAVTGASPFGEGPAHAVLFRVVHEDPALIGVPASLVDLLRGCLAKEPTARPGLEEVLAALTAASPSRVGGDGGWLPEALTDVLARYTLAFTRVETEQDRPRERNPAAPEKQRRQATGSGMTTSKAPTFWRKLRDAWEAGTGTDEQRNSPERAGGAELVVGNLSAYPMEVVVDGTVLGTAPGLVSRAFPVSPGHHTLLACTEGRGVTRRIKVVEGDATKIAFDLSPGPQPAPEVVEQVVFIGSLPLGFPGLFRPPPRLVLSRLGLRPPRLPESDTCRWDLLDQVSVVGEGNGAQVVVWPRKGWPLETTKTLKDYQGGKVVCTAKEINATDPPPS